VRSEDPRVSGSWRVSTTSLAIVTIAAVLLGAANAAKMLAEFDLPWHLAFGRQIASTWSVPRVDDFAYTHSQIHYVGVVADLTLYAIIRFAGPLGLQIANGLVAIAIASAMVLTSSTRTRGFHPISLGVVAAAMVAMSPWTFVRPATFGFLLVGVTLLLVQRYRAGDRRALLAAAALALVWCNMHGSVVVGVAVLGAYAAYRGLCTMTRDRYPIALPASEGGHLAMAAGAAVLAVVLACMNPAGAGIFRGGAVVGSYDDILSEWHATSVHFFTAQSPAAGAFLVVAFVLVAIGKGPDGTRKISLFDAALVLGSLLLATRIRFVPVAIVVIAPIAASRVASFVHETPMMRAAFLLAACLAGPSVAALDEGTYGVGFDPQSFPEPAVRFITEAKPSGNMWNFWPFGGYLIWRLYPEHRVLLDGRIGFVHERDLVYQVIASETDAVELAKLSTKYHFEWAVCRVGEGRPWCAPIARSEEWRMVFADHASAVYVRTTGPNAALAENGYRVLTHLSAPETIFEAAVRGERSEDLSHDAALARTQDPTSPRVWFIDACAALAVGDHARFESARARLALLAPNHAALAVLDQAGAARFAK
jgi:hypothetical protein